MVIFYLFPRSAKFQRPELKPIPFPLWSSTYLNYRSPMFSMYPYNQSQGWWYIVTNYDRDKHYPGNLNDSLLAGFSNSFIFSFQWTKTWFSATPFVARSSQTNVSRRAWPQSSILVFSNLAKDVSKVDNVVWTTHKVCRCRRWYSRQDLHAHILHYRQLSRRIRPYSVSIFYT